MTDCAILENGKPPKPVKNLGWLLKNWKHVKTLELRPYTARCAGPGSGCLLAHLRDGRIYWCRWADIDHCRQWLERPVFRGLPVRFRDKEERC